MSRANGRRADELRPVRIQRGYTKHAEGAVLVEFGDTKVLCTASAEERVPPSACSTSQSIWMLRGPRARRSTTARSARPISRWISCVRPDCLPRAASRSLRVLVARGSMPYSAVTQPRPVSLRNGGTRSSALAVHST